MAQHDERWINDELSRRYVRSLRRVASTVVMVTSHVEGRPWGLTVSAFNSVSAAPPLLLVSTYTRTATYSSVVKSGVFGVSVLCPQHLSTARFGSAAGKPKFLEAHCSEHTAFAIDGPEEVEVPQGRTDAISPEIPGALAHYHCTLEDAPVVADHALLIGRVRSMVEPATPEQPLLYWDGAFRSLGPTVTEPGGEPAASVSGSTSMDANYRPFL
jgi:flavin reductase ActVB